MKQTLINALTSSLIMLALCANANENDVRLFLVGGGLKTCSSMALAHCKTKDFLVENAKYHASYQITSNNIDLLFKAWPKQYLVKQRFALKSLLRQANTTENPIYSKKQLIAHLKQFDHSRVISKLADKEYFMLLDALEVVPEKGLARVQEQVSLKNNKNGFAKDLYQQFVQLAKFKANNKQPQANSKPKVLVVTASARDSFESVDFYRQVFSQAGAETQWLAIDAAVNKAWQQPGNVTENCNQLAQFKQQISGTIKRSQVYPEYFKQQQKACLHPEYLVKAIKQADGLFINGGDQSLTLQSFKNSDGTDNVLLQAIRHQLIENKLIVGGTSAGTAVMAGNTEQTLPMITNGRSEVALFRGAKADVLPNAGCQKAKNCEQLRNDDLTYNSLGGLGLFTWGITDTHFSERSRQGRLVTLVQQTKAQLGFGVDEATALLVSWPERNASPKQITLAVQGQSGVYLVEQQNDKVLTHYLTRDDKIMLDPDTKQLTFELAKWKQLKPDNTPIVIPKGNIFNQDDFYQTGMKFCLSSEKKAILSVNWQNNKKHISLFKSKQSQTAIGAVKLDQQLALYCSYTNVLWL